MDSEEPDVDPAGDRRASLAWLLALPLALVLGWAGLGDPVLERTEPVHPLALTVGGAGVGDPALQRPEPVRPTPIAPAVDGLPERMLAGHRYGTSFTVRFPADWPAGNHAVVTATWGPGGSMDSAFCSETVDGSAQRTFTLAGCELSFGREESGVVQLLVLPSSEPDREDTPQWVTRSWPHRVVTATAPDPHVEDARRLCGERAEGAPLEPLFGPRVAQVGWTYGQALVLRCGGVLPSVCVEPVEDEDEASSCERLPGGPEELRAYPYGPGVVGIAPLGTARLEALWRDGAAPPVEVRAELAADGGRLFSLLTPLPLHPLPPGTGPLPRVELRALDAGGRELASRTVGVCDPVTGEQVDPSGACRP
ncbi:hypothetical protein [Kineococcus gypseus]|uniref:hypothetical protein n=1 Tax=Kineococcus gypseus TaxID=1637102 RepID=UPI003D7DCE98